MHRLHTLTIKPHRRHLCVIHLAREVYAVCGASLLENNMPSKNKSWFKKGYKVSIAIKKKMSKAKKGNITGFQKGFTPWNKGKKIPFKSRPYQEGKPTWNKGKSLPPLSLKCRLKMSKSHKKIAHKCHFWRGGITSLNLAIRNRVEYKQWREAVFTRDNWTCQECGARSKKNCYIRIEAHHIKPFATFPELRFKIDNGKTLCKKCHDKKPKGREINI